MNSFYSKEELKHLGLKSYGENVSISRFAQFYSPQNISIQDNVRIDDFCILSGSITIGSNVHISAYVALYGALGIKIGNYCGVSARSTIYSAMDDFSGEHLIGPMSPEGTTKVDGGEVILEDYSQVGCHCVVFPAVVIGKGCVIGAGSLVKKSTSEWSIYVGSPARYLKSRSNSCLSLVRNNG